MLITSELSAFKKNKKIIKPYFLMKNNGNDEVIPDSIDLKQYKDGVLTWQGFKINYLAKLMRPSAEEWMERISNEAVLKDVVLVSDEIDSHNCFRILLAERMVNMFSGIIKIKYEGELTD